jgi:hypothetical protein
MVKKVSMMSKFTGIQVQCLQGLLLGAVHIVLADGIVLVLVYLLVTTEI